MTKPPKRGCRAWLLATLLAGAGAWAPGVWAQGEPAPAPSGPSSGPSATSAPAAAMAAAPAGLPPAELFYQRPNIEGTALSPSGRWLAMATRGRGQRTVLVVFDLKAWKPLATAASFADSDIRSFAWVNDERLVFDLIDRQRGGGDQRFGSGLFAVSRDGSGLRPLIRLRERAFVTEERWVGPEPLSPAHDLLHVPAGGGDEVVVGEYRRSETGEPDGIIAKRLNIVTGRTRNLSDGLPRHVAQWWFGPDGEPKAVLTVHQGRAAVHWRGAGPGAGEAQPPDAEAARWRVLAEAGTYELPFKPRFVDAAGSFYVSVSAGADGISELRRFDFQTGRPEPEPVVSTPGFDFTGALVSEEDTGRALGVRVVTDAQTTVWFDPALAAIQAEADRRLPGLVNQLQCRPCSGPGATVVVRSWSDRDPGQIWVHWPAEQRWRPVGAVRGGIDPRRMASTDFERIRARDGLEFPVWITRPAGARAGPLPTVMLVHGGPWVRGRHWEWSAHAQFLASRGYLVVEPEFRGSTGFGQRLFRAGWKQWGQAMQDDVADALAWAVKRGDADPQRVCIAGASYGGYAALMGLVRHGEQYRCAAAWVAVTDPRLLYSWHRDGDVSAEFRQFGLPQLVGDATKDAAMLDTVSPVLQADRLRAPLLLAFGAEDRRVPLVHGTRLRDALRVAGRDPEYVVYLDEGHGWLRLENQVDFAGRLERFLAQHLR